ncbi:rab-3A-interacting protein-like [Uloborus diversus]|uniref:rab-3A-interacting protein-like n=1 Tax=Uloborus diversus TaxID=327109 RepID=UPI002408F3BF|nr:rab-3A-interacting protein-like [Uloborus diversus]
MSSSEYVIRASAMRNKIEEKITEIEKKINLPNSELHSESLESISSPPDYNMIQVLDARRSRSLSVSELRQSTIDRLQSNLEKAEKDLELREEEVAKLRKIRDEVGSEIEDLTASLFEEANNIAKKAHMKQQRAERIAKEANMKLAMLQDEVGALKAIVEASNVCSPPIDSLQVTERRHNISHRQSYEVDPIFNKEYIVWRQNPSFNKEDPFLKRIYEEDIFPCLNFANKELAKNVLSAIEEDKMIIEKIHLNKNEPLPK